MGINETSGKSFQMVSKCKEATTRSGEHERDSQVVVSGGAHCVFCAR